MQIYTMFLSFIFMTCFVGQPFTHLPKNKLYEGKAALIPADKQAQSSLLQSEDGGRTWGDLASLPENIEITRIFAQNGEVFLAAPKGQVYHNSNPKTGEWQKEEFLGEVSGFFKGKSGTYVSIYEGGFFKKTPNTSYWQAMHTNLKDKEINSMVENEAGILFVACPSGIYKSADEGKTWKHVFDKSWATSLTVAHNILIGNAEQGLMRSTDEGEHWECVLNDVGGVYRTKVVKGGFAAIRVAGQWHTPADNNPMRTSLSADGGQTWLRIDEGQFFGCGAKQEWASLTAKNWFCEDKSAFFDYRIYDLEESGPYLFCSHKGGISRSSNGGKNWEHLYAAPKAVRFNLVVSGQTLFAVAMPDYGC